MMSKCLSRKANGEITNRRKFRNLALGGGKFLVWLVGGSVAVNVAHALRRMVT